MRTMALHDTEEFHHDLRGRANENLALSTTLSVDNAFLQNIAFRDGAMWMKYHLPDNRSMCARRHDLNQERHQTSIE